MAAPHPGARSAGVIIGILFFGAVVVVGGLILAVTFLGTSAQPRFEPVGQAIDRSDPSDPGGAVNSPESPRIIEEAPAASSVAVFLPVDEDVEASLEVVDGRVSLQRDEPIEAGPVTAFCGDEPTDSAGGHMRVWTGGGGSVEVDVRINDMGSAAEARRSIEMRQNDEFLSCIADAIEPQIVSSIVMGEVVDSSSVTTGDQRELRVLIESRSRDSALLLWRQVGRYSVSAKIFEEDFDDGVQLDLAAADDLLAMTTEALED